MKNKTKKKFVPILDPKVDDLCALLAQILARTLAEEKAAKQTELLPPPGEATPSESSAS